MPLARATWRDLAPQRVAGHVGRDHRLAPERGGAAGPGLGPDDQAVGLVQADVDERRRGGHRQGLGAVVQQQDGAAGAGGLGLDHLGQGVQGLHQGGVAGDQVEHLGLAGQLALGPLALGDVAAVEHHPADGRVVEQVVGQGLDVAPGPVGGQEPEAEPGAVGQPGQVLAEAGPDVADVVGVDQLEHVLADPGVLAVAEHAPEGRAGVGDAAAGVEHDHHVGGVLDQRPEAGRRVPQGLLGPLQLQLLGDVAGGQDEPAGPAVDRRDPGPGAVEPAGLAVGPQHLDHRSAAGPRRRPSGPAGPRARPRPGAAAGPGRGSRPCRPTGSR